MVFESLVVDLVNRFLGDFIENLDKSQLSIGIWGGDVVLNNLFVRENLLDELNLPIKVAFGNIGKLTLKIPWKNLYTEPTIALLDGLYVIAVPNSSIAYDAAKEDKGAWETKQKELARIEEAKKREAEKDQAKDPKQDTFAEKLITNVIKNLEVKVTNIHIRYEDSYTNPAKLFSIGVTLRELSCQTTNDNWVISVIKEATALIYKLLKLDSLSLYWNVSPTRYIGKERVDILTDLKTNIVSAIEKTDYQYMVEPMMSNAQLRLHTKPDEDKFTLPKLFLEVIFEEIAIALSKGQFQVLMEFLESFERMQLGSKFRKYHPKVPLAKNANVWWKFAYTCILEETVRRRRKMWSWDNMLRHRVLCRQYKDLYKTKLMTSKPSADLLANLEKCERDLDVLNITMMRQKANVEAKKEGAKKQGGSGGWFGGWFGKGKQEATAGEKSVGDKVQEIMTPEEKQKLYEAIGYQDSVDTVFPIEYVATKLLLKLKSLQVKLVDDDVGKTTVLQLQLKGVGADVSQRPSASAIKVSANIESLLMNGLASSVDKTSVIPTMVTSLVTDTGAFFDVLFETNPQDGACDTRIVVNAKPVEVVYDAKTVIALAEFFKPPESVHVVQLQAAAMAKFEQVKEQTATGFQYALEQHKFTDITVHLQPAHVLIPEGGVNKPNCRMLVLDMGQLRIATEKPALRSDQSLAGGDYLSTPRLSLDDMKKQAYDRFKLNLESFQLLFVNPGEDWMKARVSGSTDMHVLRPMSINIDFYKTIIPDIEVPKMRIVGDLPILSIYLSDEKLLNILSLVQNLPLPEGAPAAAGEEADASLKVPDLKYLPIKEQPENVIAKFQSGEGSSPVASPQGVQPAQTSALYNATDIELKFEIKEISVGFSERKNGVDIPIIKIVIESLGTELKVCTYDTSVTAYLGGIYLQHTQFKASDEIMAWYANRGPCEALSNGPLINLVNTPIVDEQKFKLLSVHVLMAQKKHPDLATTYENTLQKIDVTFSALELLLHQEAILSLMELGESLQRRMEKPKDEAAGPPLARHLSTVSLASVSSAAMKKFEPRRGGRKKAGAVEVIDMALNARLDILSIAICTQEKFVTDIKIKGLESRVTLQKSMTSVTASLKDITVFDHVPQAIYPKILSFEGGEVFKAAITIFNDATSGSNYSDMQCVDTKVVLNTGCMKVVFLNKFVQDLLNFLNQFQAAKEKIGEAGSAVKEKAASAAQDLSEKATRISLSIDLKAPVIIIPKNSRSNDALVVDLGTLSVSNGFQVLAKKDSKGLPAILDGMLVKLTLLKIYRAVVMETEVKADCLILKPVTLEVKIVRNLSASWYHGHPDVEISATLHNFSISLSQGDFTTMLSILNENLQEGAVATEVQLSSSTEVKSAPELPSSVSKTLSDVPPVKIEPSTVPATDVYSNMKACFTVESIQLELFTGDSDLSVGSNQRDNEKSLAKLELKMIELKTDIKSDKSIEAIVGLSVCQLSDSRPTRQSGITLMLTPSKNGGQGDPAKMIELKFIQDAVSNKDVDMKVNNLYIVVCLEFLLKVKDFFVDGLPEAASKTTPSPASTQESSKSPPALAAPPPTPSTDVSQAEMKLQFSLNHPEIILVEDAMNPDTSALFLGLQVDFSLRASPILESMKGSVKGLSIEASKYSAPPETVKHQILSPVDVQLHSNAPYGRNRHLAIMMTDIFLTVSSDSIRIVTAAAASLSAPKVESIDEQLMKIPKDLWAIKKIEDCNFWFLKTADQSGAGEESGMALLDKDLSSVTLLDDDRGEQLVVSQFQIIITLLCGVDRRTIPLVISGLALRNVDVRNWSTNLHVGCELTLEVAYYNEKLSVWESLVEPVEADGRHRPWELEIEVCSNDLMSGEEETDVDSPAQFSLPPPQMTVNVTSSNVMQVTVSKTALDVFKSLGQSFSDAYQLVSIEGAKNEVVAPYVIKNESGMSVSVKLSSTFQAKPNAKAIQETEGVFTLEPDQSLELFNEKDEKIEKKPVGGMDSLCRSVVDDQTKKIFLTFEDMGETRELRVMRAEKRAFGLNQRAYPSGVWNLVAQTDTSFGCKTITLRSVVQVRNCLPLAVEMYYKLSDDASARCGQVEPGCTCSLPCDAVYAEPCQIYFKPTQGSYMESATGCKWKDTPAAAQVFECKGAKETSPTVFISAKVEIENVLFESTLETSAKSYLITLTPTVVFRNLLPVPILCLIEGSESNVKVEAGEKMQLMSANPGTTSLTVTFTYQSRDWTGRQVIDVKPETLTAWNFESMDNGKRIGLDIGLHSDISVGYLQMSLYSPYWMINKTGHDLQYKASDDYIVKHEAAFKDVVFFLFKKTSGPVGGSKKVALKFDESDWSDKFSLDTVGSVGTIMCKVKGETSPVGMKITLASSGLTKIVTFMPFYTVVNQANFTVMYKEHSPNAEWFEVEPGGCVAFWPIQTKNQQLVASIKNTSLETKPFDITESHTTLLQLYHDYGGINVEVQAVEGAIAITFQHYINGFATALLVNHTISSTIEYHQKDLKEQTQSLMPKHAALYTWQDPVSKRELIWSCGEKKEHKDELIKDGIGDIFENSDTKLYWVSFLDGMQRVLLFTDDIALATMAQQAGELERVEMEMNLSLQGFGLSLVNNALRKEIAYLGITSSGVIWEHLKRKRYKALKTKQSLILEDGYQKYLMEVTANKTAPGRRTLDDKIEVDFGADPMLMFKPHKTKIKRSFEHGIWLQHRTSPHQTQLHLKIHRLQLDNQLAGAVFPTVLAPTPPPKSVAADSVPKPFTELSVMIRKSSHSNVMQFKYCKLLIQEMAVKVDQGFIGAMLALFASGTVDDTQQLFAFKQDCELIDKTLLAESIQSSTSDVKNFYDMLHFSPLKVHLSFSMYGADEAESDKKPQIQWNVLALFLQSVGIVLTDIQDVVFKLGYFERKYAFYSQSQLVGQIATHYSQQAIKQMYVLVLGLDVLGNPFGVIRGLACGIEDLFYEPYQGAIQGPEEFAEGLALGVRSLLGHAVGGAAGAVSRITGALGKGIATLTMDDDYQKSRREALNKRPADLKEGLARGGKGLVMGVVHGVTGIVTQPMEGAKQEGVGGFFKGMGKGLVGVFTRPASGVVDFASSSFEGIRRVAENSDEVHRLRPARFIQADGILRPYVFREAEGYQILQEVDKGKYANEVYLGHLYVSADGRNVLLGTDRRVVFISRGELFGHWDSQWNYTWDLLREAPSISPKGIQVLLKEKQKKLIGSGSIGKMVTVLEKDRKYAEAFVARMKAAMTAAEPTQ